MALLSVLIASRCAESRRSVPLAPSPDSKPAAPRICLSDGVMKTGGTSKSGTMDCCDLLLNCIDGRLALVCLRVGGTIPACRLYGDPASCDTPIDPVAKDAEEAVEET